MRWTYHANHGAFYLYISEARPDRQVDLGNGVVLDIGADGTPSGVEIVPFGRHVDLAPLRAAALDVQALRVLAVLVTSGLPRITNGTSVTQTDGDQNGQADQTLRLELIDA